MDYLSRRQNRLPADVISAGFDSSTAHEIDAASEKYLKLVSHLDHVEQAPVSVGSESDQDIYVTVRTKVVPKDRTEKGKLCDLPPMAKLGDLISVDRNAWAHCPCLSTKPFYLLMSTL
jgi:hypothetical protein